jgi:hypothetical protein
MFDRKLYIKLVEQYTNDREYAEKFIDLYDFGCTDFNENKMIFIDKTMSLEVAQMCIEAK